ncbi:Enamine deaminase RidA, house cleaning of reactive enamine intermediates, YjgF/YER057c/UK114 family [Albimonas donghaensis]|uniref:Enamine deaminase RidA, house cleaning of reactive enamine intermediates, YjgF/YER057c/UK114 family n=1 Tax=Albimonas donghaensis TaxID=356660 RepID=A0A1H2YQQ9_9RHOB|nr:RidA family protein [Albimonas donghaensis]SDX07410.1 Enamine deaminase RidA, house cleaning of reactive enamine intermediates, YjgF/YER057c/UK114 family [Albimonas donghaensis]
MRRREVAASDAPQSKGGFAPAVETVGASRTLWVSGQIPVTASGEVPEGFEAQARVAWANVEAQLRAGGMGLSDIVKVTTFLSDRRYAMPNREVRAEVLGELRPALTVIVCDIFDEAWLLEIEAVAQA